MSTQRRPKRNERPFSQRFTDIHGDEAFPLVRARQPLAPLQTKDEEEEDTVIDIASADLEDAFDFGDAAGPATPRMVPAASGTVAVAKKADWEEADTTAYADGLRIDLLELARVAVPGRVASGKGRR
jgi:hypothetical protein